MLVGEFEHAVRQSRRKHHIEALGRMRQTPQDEADVLDESQIEHAVRFIQHRHLNMPQVEHMLLEVIDDAARRADQHVDAFLEDAPLLLVVDSAEHDGELEAGIFADAFGVGVDLHREFARRRDDDGARRVDAVDWRHAGSVSRRLNRAMRNAAVLPVPVCA